MCTIWFLLFLHCLRTSCAPKANKWTPWETLFPDAYWRRLKSFHQPKYLTGQWKDWNTPTQSFEMHGMWVPGEDLSTRLTLTERISLLQPLRETSALELALIACRARTAAVTKALLCSSPQRQLLVSRRKKVKSDTLIKFSRKAGFRQPLSARDFTASNSFIVN